MDQQDQSVALFALAHAAAHSPVWDGSDLASLLCTCTGAATALPGTALKVVLKSQQHAESFMRWLSTHGRLCSGLVIKLDKRWWPIWMPLEHYGGVVHYGSDHGAAAAALMQTMQAGSLSQLLSFTCCHAFPTEGLLQVLPTSLTQLHLSYETNNLGEAPEPMEWSDEDSDGERTTFVEEVQWHEWVTPLVDGLARLTGLRSLTLSVDIEASGCDENYACVKYPDNSAILHAVSPLTLLTELRLTNSKFEDLEATPKSILQLTASLQSLEVYESSTFRSRGQSLDVSLSHLSALTRLDLGDCHIPGPREGGPPTLPPSLRRISCTSSEGGGCDLAVLKALPALEHLEPRCSAETLVELAAGLGRSQLTHVKLSFGFEKEHRSSSGSFGLSEAIDSLEAAGLLDAVRGVQLWVGDCHAVGPEVPQQLAHLRNVTSLAVPMFLQFDDPGLAAFSCLTALTALDMDHYHIYSKKQLLQQVPAVLEQMPSLRRLVVPNRGPLEQHLSAEERQALRSRLQGLTHLTCVGWLTDRME